MACLRRELLAPMLALAAVVALAWGAPQQASAERQGGDLIVFAAASLKNALDAVSAEWQKETGRRARISYAASPALAHTGNDLGGLTSGCTRSPGSIRWSR